MLLQVPPPTPGAEQAQKLEAERRSIIAREAAELSALADELAREGKPDAAKLVRAELPRSDVARRADAVHAVCRKSSSLVSTADAALPTDVRQRFEGAPPRPFSTSPGKPLTPNRRSTLLASFCLRACSSATPITRKRGGCWDMSRMAEAGPRRSRSRQLKMKNVNHPTFGWVPADWVPHLDRGELPAPSSKGQKNLAGCRLPRPIGCEPIGAQRWRFATEHFEIQTNVPLAEAITFGRRLEAFHDLFMTLLADILGENLPIIRLFKSPTLAGRRVCPRRSCTRSITSRRKPSSSIT